LEVTGGLVELGLTAPPKDTTDRLYNESGTLKWNGLDVTSQGVTTFSDLTDTNIVSAEVSQVLVFHGGKWRNLSVTNDISIEVEDTSGDGTVDFNISSGAVSSAKLGSKAVTLAKIQDLARGDVIVGDSSSRPIVVNGATNEVLTTNASGDAVWAEAATGAADGNSLDLGADPTVDESPDYTLDLNGTAASSAAAQVGRTWTSSTAVTTAIDDLNEILGLLIPTKPADVDTFTLAMITEGYHTPKLCGNTVTDNTSGGTVPAAGTLSSTTFARTLDGTPNTDYIQDAYNAAAGTVTLFVNNVDVGNRIMTAGNDGGSYGALQITDDRDFDAEGFWKSFDARGLSMTASAVGVHRAKIKHSVTGETSEVYWVKDTLSTPALSVSSATVEEQGTPVKTKSSGVDHYGDNAAVVRIAGDTVTNAAKTHYIGSRSGIANSPYFVSQTDLSVAVGDHSTTEGSGSGVVLDKQNKTYAEVLLSAWNGSQVNKDSDALTSLTTGTTRDITLNNTPSSFCRKLLVGSFYNVSSSGASTGTYTNKVILKKTGTVAASESTSLPYESGVDIATGLGSSGASTAPRINMSSVAAPSTDNPALTVVSEMADWVSTSSLELYAASVVAGVARHDQTNYASGFLPAGPNLSTGRSGAQYINFKINRYPVTNFLVRLAGKISGCWIYVFKNGGSPVGWLGTSGANYWSSALTGYGGSGLAGVGCGVGAVMVDGTTYSSPTDFQLTTGTTSGFTGTSSTTGEESIYIRFLLNDGDYIKYLRFKPTS